MNGLFNDVWEGKDVILLDHTVETTLAVCVYFILAIMILLALLINTINTNLQITLFAISIAGKCNLTAFSQNVYSYRIWAANVMERGQSHSKRTPDVNERSSPHRLYRNLHQTLIPRLDFEAYETVGFYQGCF
jgi:hypothetical protein